MKSYDASEQAYKNGYDAGKPKWTPVTQRVPESHLEQLEDIDGTHYTVISDFVLGYTAEGEMIVVQHEVGDERDWWIDCNGGDYTVTHWMPLPGKPEVEK